MITSKTCYNSGCQSLQKWDIGNVVREILISDDDIHNVVGNNIYPLVASEDVNGEFIVYQRDKYSKKATKMGIYEDLCELYVTAISDNYDKAINLASLIDNALVGDHILDGGQKVHIDLADSTETYDDNKYIETLLFSIK